MLKEPGLCMEMNKRPVNRGFIKALGEGGISGENPERVTGKPAKQIQPISQFSPKYFWIHNPTFSLFIRLSWRVT